MRIEGTNFATKLLNMIEHIGMYGENNDKNRRFFSSL